MRTLPALPRITLPASFSCCLMRSAWPAAWMPAAPPAKRRHLFRARPWLLPDISAALHDSHVFAEGKTQLLAGARYWRAAVLGAAVQCAAHARLELRAHVHSREPGPPPDAAPLTLAHFVYALCCRTQLAAIVLAGALAPARPRHRHARARPHQHRRARARLRHHRARPRHHHAGARPRHHRAGASPLLMDFETKLAKARAAAVLAAADASDDDIE